MTRVFLSYIGRNVAQNAIGPDFPSIDLSRFGYVPMQGWAVTTAEHEAVAVMEAANEPDSWSCSVAEPTVNHALPKPAGWAEMAESLAAFTRCCPHCGSMDCTSQLDGDCPYQYGGGNYRVDMDDSTGTIFCAACAEAAWESGLYTDDSPTPED